MVSAPSRERPTTEQTVTGTPVLDSAAAPYNINLFTCLCHTYSALVFTGNENSRGEKNNNNFESQEHIGPDADLNNRLWQGAE